MSEDAFDVLIVGGGIAGCVAGYLLADAGLETIIIERGNYSGSKNMTGGRLYAHSLEKVMPGFAADAPVERRVVKERISLTTETDNVTVEYAAGGPEEPESDSYTVLRANFDQWLMGKAEEAGAQIIPGVRVEEVVTRDGKVVGVRADGDVLEAKAVILADGVLSILGEQLGMVKRVSPSSVAVGAKELISLSEETIQDRFGLEGNQGMAWMFAGYPSAGHMGGGFLYTNKESVALGVVCGLHGIETAQKSVPQMLEDFKAHPAVRPLIAGGELAEYSGHVVPEAGVNMCPELVGDGVLIVGDAAGFCLNLGYTVRGMDLAVASAQAAAQTLIQAHASGDFSRNGLSGYRKLLESSPMFEDLRLYRKLPDFMENNSRVFNEYPAMAAGLMRDLFHIDGTGERPLRKKITGRLSDVGYLKLASDMIKGVRAL